MDEIIEDWMKARFKGEYQLIDLDICHRMIKDFLKDNIDEVVKFEMRSNPKYRHLTPAKNTIFDRFSH
jgi:hypothetical protein